MKATFRIILAVCLASAMAGARAAAPSSAAPTWTEGKNYFLVVPARPTSVGADKVEVTEVFSYACPACNLFLPVMHQLKRELPATAVITYLPASFQTAEDWPMFQLAFVTAQVLGVAEQTHDAMFDAVWKTGELATMDPTMQHIRDHLPTIEEAAKFYNRTAGVPVAKFLSTSKEFSVDAKVRGDEEAIRAYKIDRTPTLIVNGKYRLQVESAGGNEELVQLVKWLVAKESK